MQLRINFIILVKTLVNTHLFWLVMAPGRSFSFRFINFSLSFLLALWNIDITNTSNPTLSLLSVFMFMVTRLSLGCSSYICLFSTKLRSISVYSLLLCHLFFLRLDFVALIVWNWLRRLQTFHLKYREILEQAFSQTGFLRYSLRLSFVFAFLELCAKL